MLSKYGLIGLYGLNPFPPDTVYYGISAAFRVKSEVFVAY